MYTKRDDCRVCGGTQLTRFLELGPQPLANNFLTKEGVASGKQASFPLDVYVCHDCHHVQLLDIVSKETLFSHYLYFSTTTKSAPAHFAEYADEVAREHTQPGDMVVEMGSNDGILLSALNNKGLRILGVEPATNVAEVARKRGIPTMNRFFTMETADMIARDLGRAKVIIGNNVVGHIDDLAQLVKSVDHLLTDDGTWIFEVPYVVDLIEKNEFDTVYHEHLSYFAVRPAMRMLERGGLKMVDVRRQWIHGGTIRIYAKKKTSAAQPTARVAELVRLEEQMRLHTLEPYRALEQRVMKLRDELRRIVLDAKAQGKRVVGYGAPAKGNTLLNYCKLGADMLDYLSDTTPAKQGLYSPGMHIPVVSPDHFHKDNPAVAVMLAWNFEKEILAKEEAWRKAGGQFVIPIPTPRVV